MSTSVLQLLLHVSIVKWHEKVRYVLLYSSNTNNILILVTYSTMHFKWLLYLRHMTNIELGQIWRMLYLKIIARWRYISVMSTKVKYDVPLISFCVKLIYIFNLKFSLNLHFTRLRTVFSFRDMIHWIWDILKFCKQNNFYLQNLYLKFF